MGGQPGVGGATGMGGAINGGVTGTGGAGAGGVGGAAVGTGGGGASPVGDGALAATCNDGFKNQDETDTDCGGATCTARCVAGRRCLVNSDCAVTTPPLACDPTTNWCTDACQDNKMDRDETGVDCGGSCPFKCTDDPCTDGTQCQSGTCDATLGTCKAPEHPLANIDQTCWDGIAGFNPGDKTGALTSIVPCMIANSCCKLPQPFCSETCFTSNDGACGVNKTGGGMGPHDFILAYYKKCVP